MTQYGKLAELYGFGEQELKVYQSGAGFYIGTWDEEGPISRESVEYYSTVEEAKLALKSGTWTQRQNG